MTPRKSRRNPGWLDQGEIPNTGLYRKPKRKAREVWLTKDKTDPISNYEVCFCGKPDSHNPPARLFREVLPRRRQRKK